MQTSEVRSLVDYLYWVNGRLLDAAVRLPPDEFTAPSELRTRDLRATLVHELDVEWSWRLSLQGRPLDEFGPDEELRPADFPTAQALRERWEHDESEMRAWIESLSDDDLAADVVSPLAASRRPLWQYVMHIVVHACQQQADAATLLTRAGQSPGEIGYLEYLRAAAPGT